MKYELWYQIPLLLILTLNLILITIKWDCMGRGWINNLVIKSSFLFIQSFNDCKPRYTFRRIDIDDKWNDSSHMLYESKSYSDGGKKGHWSNHIESDLKLKQKLIYMKLTFLQWSLQCQLIIKSLVGWPKGRLVRGKFRVK